ncbi:MAG: superinfection immunity protein [Terracidiphilus sp.]|nr:superinfection immunity protein [Terracidiphilus sp.]MDR3797940.1 superinfection immunity protein [Terracidiphilus sp.]
MNNLLRLLVIVGIVACCIFVVALGLARHDADLMGPVNLVLFVLGALVYLLPTGLAIYRDCRSMAWIAVVNVLLGWTILGWFAAMGWATAGKVRAPVHPVSAPPTHPVLGH